MAKPTNTTKIAAASLAAVAALLTVAGVTAALLSAPFSDVPDSHEYASEINAAHAMGLVDGVSEGLYDPEGILTENQATRLVESLLDRFTDANGDFELLRGEAAALLVTGICGLEPDTTGCQDLRQDLSEPEQVPTTTEPTTTEPTTTEPTTTEPTTTEPTTTEPTSTEPATGDWTAYDYYDAVDNTHVVGWYLAAQGPDELNILSNEMDIQCLGTELRAYVTTHLAHAGGLTDGGDYREVNYIAEDGDRKEESWLTVQRQNSGYVLAPDAREFIEYVAEFSGQLTMDITKSNLPLTIGPETDRAIFTDTSGITAAANSLFCWDDSDEDSDG